MKDPSLTGKRVLALGSGITLLGVIRVLGHDGAEVYALPDADATTRRSRWFRPAPEGLRGVTGATLAERLNLLEQGTVLIPCSDDWALALAGLPRSVTKRFPVCSSSAETLGALIDKTHLRASLMRLGIRHPHTVPVTREADLETIPASQWDHRFLKPADSQHFFEKFHMKAFPVAALEETRRNLRRCLDAGFSMLLQEYIPGPPTNHYFIDGFIDRQGESRALFARRRLRMFPLEYGNSSLMVSVAASEVAEAARAVQLLLADVHYRGIYSAEFKRDARDGRFNLIEVNARPWWYIEFAARCGVDVSALAVKDALGLPLTSTGSYAVGRRCAYWSADLAATRVERAAGRLTIPGMLRSWIGAYHPILRWSDPAPMMGIASSFVGRRLRGVATIF